MMGRKKNDVVVCLGRFRELRASSLRARLAPQVGRVHREQVISTKLLAFPLESANERRPSGMRDPLALLPLLGSPERDADVVGHFRDGVPALKDIRHGLHSTECAGDGLSRQVSPNIPVTARGRARTMCPDMGRGTTPTKFRGEFADRLRSARITAGYRTQAEFAAVLRVGLERYKKWESGRTPMPHQYVKSACHLLHVDANFLFDTEPRAARKTA